MGAAGKVSVATALGCHQRSRGLGAGTAPREHVVAGGAAGAAGAGWEVGAGRRVARAPARSDASPGRARSPSNTWRLLLSSVCRPPHSRRSLCSASPPSWPATSAKERLSVETGRPQATRGLLQTCSRGTKTTIVLEIPTPEHSGRRNNI